jgi:hypothetical protein
MDDDLAHAGSDFETLDGHGILQISAAGFLACLPALRHCVLYKIKKPVAMCDRLCLLRWSGV